MFKDLFIFIRGNFGWVSTPTTLFVLQFMVGGIPHLPQIFMYAGYILAAIYLLTSPELKLDILWLTLIVFIPISILLASPDPLFQSPIRYALFATLLLSASALINSDRARKFRRQCLNITGMFACIMAVGSFPCYFLGINFFESRFDDGYLTDYLENAGHFSGLSTHSMLLGPLSGFAMVFLFYYATVKNHKKLWPLIIMCGGSALFAASRGAIVAAVVGFVAVMYFSSSSSSQFRKRLIQLGLIMVISFPLWGGALDSVMMKQKARQSQSDKLLDTRAEKFDYRLAEFASSPLYGVGFSAIDIHGGDSYNPSTGQIEPGTSWLAILAQTGLIGFILVIMIFRRSYKYARDSDDPYRILFLGLLAFYSVHMLVEGYAFGAGNPITYILWLAIGCCYDLKNVVVENV